VRLGTGRSSARPERWFRVPEARGSNPRVPTAGESVEASLRASAVAVWPGLRMTPLRSRFGVWTRRVGRADDCARVLTARAHTPRGFESPTLLCGLAPVAQEGTERRKTFGTGHRQRVAEAPNGVELLLGKRVIPVCLTPRKGVRGFESRRGHLSEPREVGRAADCARLENGSSFTGAGGSNPSPPLKAPHAEAQRHGENTLDLAAAPFTFRRSSVPLTHSSSSLRNARSC
jgi:hypothetical protein